MRLISALGVSPHFFDVRTQANGGQNAYRKNDGKCSETFEW
jgi:hypothetical protein